MRVGDGENLTVSCLRAAIPGSFWVSPKESELIDAARTGSRRELIAPGGAEPTMVSSCALRFLF
jgi:hypothetical protein